MRHATILDEGRPRVAAIVADRVYACDRRLTIRDVAAGAVDAPLPSDRGSPLAEVVLGPAIRPGRDLHDRPELPRTGRPAASRPERPLIFAKLPTSVAGHGATLRWDRSLDRQGRCGVRARRRHGTRTRRVFGYTIVNDMSSRDPWLDGDQWLLGKSMAGFCPVGPWIVTPDEFDPSDLRLGCTINGEAIQDGRVRCASRSPR